jgi:hypothetical protein
MCAAAIRAFLRFFACRQAAEFHGGLQNRVAPCRISNCAAESDGVPPKMKMLPRVSGRGAGFRGGPPPFVTAQRVLQQAAGFDGHPEDFDLRQRLGRSPAEFRGVPQRTNPARRDSGCPAGFSCIPQERGTRRHRLRWSTRIMGGLSHTVTHNPGKPSSDPICYAKPTVETPGRASLGRRGRSELARHADGGHSGAVEPAVADSDSSKASPPRRRPSGRLYSWLRVAGKPLMPCADLCVIAWPYHPQVT